MTESLFALRSKPVNLEGPIVTESRPSLPIKLSLIHGSLFKFFLTFKNLLLLIMSESAVLVGGRGAPCLAGCVLGAAEREEILDSGCDAA